MFNRTTEIHIIFSAASIKPIKAWHDLFYIIYHITKSYVTPATE